MAFVATQPWPVFAHGVRRRPSHPIRESRFQAAAYRESASHACSPALSPVSEPSRREYLHRLARSPRTRSRMSRSSPPSACIDTALSHRLHAVRQRSQMSTIIPSFPRRPKSSARLGLSQGANPDLCLRVPLPLNQRIKERMRPIHALSVPQGCLPQECLRPRRRARINPWP